jgi:HlyD family secretion protein
MKTRDLILPGVAVLALLYATTSILRTQPVRELTDPPAMPPKSSFENRIAAVGLLEPSSESITLGSARAGVVDEVMVKAGDRVKKDAPLVKLRTSELQAERRVAEAALSEATAQVGVAESQVQVAQANVAVAEAELAQAKRLLSYAESVEDRRVLSSEERTQRAMNVSTAEARLSASKAAVSSATKAVTSAQASVTSAAARVEVLDVELDRSIIKAPLDSTVLQVRIRPGEHLGADAGQQAWLTLGQTDHLHLRADIDEHEAWRLKAGAAAEAQVRGNPLLKTALSFVRIEPLVIPKRSLTGDATERVDTRVLQVIFKVEATSSIPLYPGQQMDVFIEVSPELAAQ